MEQQLLDPQAPTWTTKVINKFIVVALLAIAVSLGILLNWSFANENVLVVNNSPFPTRIIQNSDGTNGVVVLDTDYCKNNEAKGTLRVSYVSSTREVFLPIAPEVLPKGCFQREFSFVIPKEIIPDTYKIKFRAVYDINPLKRGVVVEFESQEFEIQPPHTNE